MERCIPAIRPTLRGRARQHKDGVFEGFTDQYNCKLLVWYEPYDRMIDAIAREKQVKAGSRAKKVALVQGFNPEWKDLTTRSPYEWIASLRSQ